MKLALMVLGLYAATCRACQDPYVQSTHYVQSNPNLQPPKTTTHNSTSPATPFDPSLTTCKETLLTLDTCSTPRPATLLGTKKCLAALRNGPETLTLFGSLEQRVAEHTSSDADLAEVTSVVGVRCPNGMGGGVASGEVARMLEGVLERCAQAECPLGRCPVGVVSSKADGGLEVRVWGERAAERPLAARLGPSARVEMGGDEVELLIRP